MNSAAAGISIPSEGGDAADAAVATLLALAVTDYGFFAIGGEVPLLLYDAKNRQVKSPCGLGTAPLDPTAIDWFYANGTSAHGSIGAAPVPGASDLCVTALKLHGTVSFEQVVKPMLTLFDTGYEPWYHDLAITLGKLADRERETDDPGKEKLAAF